MKPEALAALITPAPSEKTGKIPNPLRLRAAYEKDAEFPEGTTILESEVMVGLESCETEKHFDSGLTHVANVIRPYSFAHTNHYTKVRWFAPGGQYTIATLSASSKEDRLRFALEDNPGLTRSAAHELPRIKDHKPVYCMMAGADGVFLWQNDEPFVVLRQQPAAGRSYLGAGSLADATVMHRRLNHKALELDVGLDNYGPQLKFWCPRFSVFHNLLTDHPQASQARVYFHPTQEDPGIYCEATPPLADKLISGYQFGPFAPRARDDYAKALRLCLNHAVALSPRLSVRASIPDQLL